MATPAPTTLSTEAVGLLTPAVYARMFDFPLTEAELVRLAHHPLTIERARELLAGELSQVLSQRDGYYWVTGLDVDDGIEARRANTAAVAVAWKAARRRACLIGLTPFVHGLMVTGSLAHDNFNQDADIDYLVLTAPRRLFTVFAVLGTVQKVTSVKTLCPNYYLTTDHMQLPERDYFVAREVLAAAPVLGPDACSRFQDDNSWAFDVFPNQKPKSAANVPRGGNFLTRAIEWLLADRLGNAVEGLFMRVLVKRIDAHYAQFEVAVDQTVVDEAKDEFRLRFHARLHRERIRKHLRDQLVEIGVEDAERILEGRPGS